MTSPQEQLTALTRRTHEIQGWTGPKADVACQRDGTTGLPAARDHQTSRMMVTCFSLLVNLSRSWRGLRVVVGGGGRTLLR
jgi:hypothetical protein